jgi:hypothetical protein
MSSERRRAPRYQLVADAEIVSPLSHVCLKARTSDVSLVGCFMNTTYALPLGTEVQLQLKYEGTTFVASGEVARSEPSMGFGVSFDHMKAEQQILMQKWLAGLTTT